jgi:NitT/TauT family transport system ATP-binding protein
MSEYKIELSHVTKKFKTKRQHIVAVDDVSFGVSEKEFITLVGPSGCGKSTIIRMIDGIITPSSGNIRIDDHKYTVKPSKSVLQNIGFVFQNHNLLPWKTVWENLCLPLNIMNLKEKKWSEHAEKLLEMVHLKNFKNSYPGVLSSSLRQRLGVIRAMVYDPDILLFDEPFGALDETLREVLDMEILNIWKKTGKTIIFITHNVSEAVLISQRILVMATNPGRIIKELTIDIPSERNLDITEDPKVLAYETEVKSLIGDVNLSVIK